MGAAAEELVAVLRVGGGVALFLQLVVLHAVGGQVGFEVLQPFGRFVLLRGVQLVAAEVGVVVDRAREGGQRAGDLAQLAGREGAGAGGEGVEVAADGGGLFEGRVEEGVLWRVWLVGVVEGGFGGWLAIVVGLRRGAFLLFGGEVV